MAYRYGFAKANYTRSAVSADAPQISDADRKNPQIKINLENVIGNPAIADRDKTFAKSLLDGFNKYKGLSVGQYPYYLKTIEKFSEENLKKTNEEAASWIVEYDAEKQRNFLICVKYYANTGYFTGIVEKFNRDFNYVPSRDEYSKITGNKYAQKVIENTVPGNEKFKVGDLIKIKDDKRFVNLHSKEAQDAAKKIYMVTEINSKPAAAVNSGRYYTIDDVVTGRTEQIQERYMVPHSWKPRKRRGS